MCVCASSLQLFWSASLDIRRHSHPAHNAYNCKACGSVCAHISKISLTCGSTEGRNAETTQNDFNAGAFYMALEEWSGHHPCNYSGLVHLTSVDIPIPPTMSTIAKLVVLYVHTSQRFPLRVVPLRAETQKRLRTTSMRGRFTWHWRSGLGIFCEVL